jgi:hypothetical protein
MGFNDRLVYDGQSTAISLDGVTAGNDNTDSPVLLMNRVKAGAGVSARVTLTAATATITLTALWQVSDDNSTWIDLMQPNNAAYVIHSTGTAAADLRVISAPNGIHAHRFARLAVRVGVTTGQAGDVGNVGYNYQLDDLV